MFFDLLLNVQKIEKPVSRSKTPLFFRWVLRLKNPVFQLYIWNTGFIAEKLGFSAKNPVYQWKIQFSIKKLGFSLLNRVSHWKTGVLDWKSGFSIKNQGFFDKKLCFSVEKTYFSNLVDKPGFSIGEKPGIAIGKWVFRRKTGFFDREPEFFDLLDIKPAMEAHPQQR